MRWRPHVGKDALATNYSRTAPSWRCLTVWCLPTVTVPIEAAQTPISEPDTTNFSTMSCKINRNVIHPPHDESHESSQYLLPVEVIGTSDMSRDSFRRRLTVIAMWEQRRRFPTRWSRFGTNVPRCENQKVSIPPSTLVINQVRSATTIVLCEQ